MEITAKESKYTQIRPGERVVIGGVPAGKAHYSLYAQSMKLQSSADLDVIFPLVTDKLFLEREGIFVYQLVNSFILQDKRGSNEDYLRLLEQTLAARAGPAGIV